MRLHTMPPGALRTGLGRSFTGLAAMAFSLAVLGVFSTPAAYAQEKSASSQPVAKDAPAKQGEQSSPDMEELRKIIERRLAEKRAAAHESGGTTPQRATVRATPGRTQVSATTQPGVKDAATTKSGCGPGTTQLDFNPPATGQPQPAFVCEHQEVDAGMVWKGKTADFKFAVKNDGAGVLNVLLKGR